LILRGEVEIEEMRRKKDEEGDAEDKHLRR
jgi:hypothetical protein